MPTYDYQCERCGHRFELFQKMTDPPRKRCPACRGKVRRLIGAGAGLLFKGGGFYITDYRSPSYQEKAKSERGDAKPLEKPGERSASRKDKSSDGKSPAPKKE